jgi:hypothetical protein
MGKHEKEEFLTHLDAEKRLHPTADIYAFINGT